MTIRFAWTFCFLLTVFCPICPTYAIEPACPRYYSSTQLTEIPFRANFRSPPPYISDYFRYVKPLLIIGDSRLEPYKHYVSNVGIEALFCIRQEFPMPPTLSFELGRLKLEHDLDGTSRSGDFTMEAGRNDTVLLPVTRSGVAIRSEPEQTDTTVRSIQTIAFELRDFPVWNVVTAVKSIPSLFDGELKMEIGVISPKNETVSIDELTLLLDGRSISCRAQRDEIAEANRPSMPMSIDLSISPHYERRPVSAIYYPRLPCGQGARIALKLESIRHPIQDIYGRIGLMVHGFSLSADDLERLRRDHSDLLGDFFPNYDELNIQTHKLIGVDFDGANVLPLSVRIAH